MHRAKNPDSVLRMFSDTYIDKAIWSEMVDDAFLMQRVDSICQAFNSWSQPARVRGEEIDLEDFLLGHREVFQRVNEE